MRASTVLKGALIAAVAACSDSGSPGGCTTSANQICMVSSTFNQATLNVTVGTKVYWQNGDAVVHSTTSSTIPATAATWDLTIAAGARDSVTFTVAGTHQYFCKFHGTANSGMRGTINVQ